MAIFATVAGALGATVRVKCPHCGKVQVRARARHHFRCSACHQAFDTGKCGTVRPVASGKRHGR
jgi:ribosomal protein S27E